MECRRRRLDWVVSVRGDRGRLTVPPIPRLRVMATGRFVPLSKRSDPERAAQHAESLYEGVPAHLEASLLTFVRSTMSTVRESATGRRRVVVRERIARAER